MEGADGDDSQSDEVEVLLPAGDINESFHWNLLAKNSDCNKTLASVAGHNTAATGLNLPLLKPGPELAYHLKTQLHHLEAGSGDEHEQVFARLMKGFVEGFASGEVFTGRCDQLLTRGGSGTQRPQSKLHLLPENLRPDGVKYLGKTEFSSPTFHELHADLQPLNLAMCDAISDADLDPALSEMRFNAFLSGDAPAAVVVVVVPTHGIGRH